MNTILLIFFFKFTLINFLMICPFTKVLLFFLVVFSFFNVSKLQAQLFSPINIPGMELWLTGDSVQILSGNLVSKCYDLSGKANNAVQNNISQQPFSISSILNNHKVIRFDGINDFMAFNSIDSIRTCFIVLKHATGTSIDYPPILGHSIYYDFIGNAGTLLTNVSYISPYILAGEIRMNSITVNPAIDLKPTNYSILTIHSTDNLRAEYITNDRNSFGYWNGDYAEIILYNRPLLNLETDTIEQYLRFKYAPPIDLGPPISLVCDTFATLTLPDYFSNILWSTGDTTNSITLFQSDTISVQATDVFGFQSSDTIILTTFQNKFSFNMISDSVSCGSSVFWSTGLDSLNYSFLWNNGATTSYLNIDSTSNYSVTATDTSGCSITSEIISILIDSFPTQTTLGIDKIVCQGAIIGLETGIGATSYLWNTNDTTAQIVIDTTGNYGYTLKTP